MIERVGAGDLGAWIRRRAPIGHRMIVGICGPPGCGKSTLSARLANDLGAAVAPMDGFHLPNDVLDERGLRETKGAPPTFDADGFVAAVRTLRRSDTSVSWPSFDRVTDAPVPDAIRVEPAMHHVLVEGNYLLLEHDPWSHLRSLLDVVAYIEVGDEVRVERLIERHVSFGRSRTDAREFVLRSDEANARIVSASRHRADVIVDGD